MDDFDLLVRTYRARLLRLVSLSTGDQDLAETVVQDCFMKAYNAREGFRGDCSVSTWLYAIALNVMRDYQRLQKFQFWKRASLAAVDLTDVDSPLASEKPSPEARMLAGEQAKHVQLALLSLSPKQRIVFIMRFLDDMEPQEISVATGMSLSTVKTHIQRAMKSVRTRLASMR
ncbi:MAG TPA: sigma-70 family RNA polymerase sigma factor [Acidobacteriaceae bacterium]|jgi:RNA polymerase sigma-70 factor (ECF subfamily)|nr:sigma-70 family RNA polymerase sigma factor [Acidobacteriaceae bacterium]